MIRRRTGRRAQRHVVIDCFPESVARYRGDHIIVTVDVIRATTMAVTAVATGRRCFLASDPDDAFALRSGPDRPLLAGELGGVMPDGFDLNNSPAALARRTDVERPIVMLSSSGTRLMMAAGRPARPAHVACFRNVAATAAALIAGDGDVALVGAGSRGEFREEDQMGCAWIAERLVASGFVATDATIAMIRRWSGAPPTACADGKSVAYLRRSGQMEDYEFIIAHVDDLDLSCIIDGREVVPHRGAPSATAVARR